jgi:hypothetical protein
MNATPAQEIPAPTAPQWVAPQVECFETRPEVTAYAGGGGPLSNR